jgi:uncharacterized membrane protein
MLIAVAVAFAVATLGAMIALWPTGPLGTDVPGLQTVREAYRGYVESVRDVPCPGTEPGDDVPCTRTAVRLVEGPDEGDPVTLNFPVGTGPNLQVGETVLLSHHPDAQRQFRYAYLDRERRPVLIAIAVLFSVAVVALGRLRGLAALGGLVGSFLVLFLFVLPAIMDGHSPILVATVGASAIAFLALYLAHGLTLRTTVALLGTLSSLLITALLGTVVMDAANFTGLGSEEAFIVQLGAAEVDLAGLLLGGIVIGALGAIDDMAVTQASAVWELRGAARDLTRRSLFRAGMRIGRDHVASTVNTLVLAYAGASLPLLILFLLTAQPAGLVANSEGVAAEIARTLVGSIGLVCCVPITTWLAVTFASTDDWRPRRERSVLFGRRGRHRAGP